MCLFQLDGVTETEITEDYLLKNRAKLKTVIPSDSSNLEPCRLQGLQGICIFFFKYLRKYMLNWKIERQKNLKSLGSLR